MYQVSGNNYLRYGFPHVDISWRNLLEMITFSVKFCRQSGEQSVHTLSWSTSRSDAIYSDWAKSLNCILSKFLPQAKLTLHQKIHSKQNTLIQSKFCMTNKLRQGFICQCWVMTRYCDWLQLAPWITMEWLWNHHYTMIQNLLKSGH